VPTCGNHTAIGTFDDHLCERNAATKLDHTALTTNLFANFCSGHVADAHFKRYASFQGISPNYRNCADDVDYGGNASPMKSAITALLSA